MQSSDQRDRLSDSSPSVQTDCNNVNISTHQCISTSYYGDHEQAKAINAIISYQSVQRKSTRGSTQGSTRGSTTITTNTIRIINKAKHGQQRSATASNIRSSETDQLDQ